MREIPKSIIPDEKQPKIKYFKPLSVEKEEVCLDATSI
jgi:hypothetical protein